MPPDDLQFDHAEYEGRPPGTTCAACNRPIEDEYFEIHGKVACPRCRAELVAASPEGSGAGRFARALLLGLGAAVLSAGLWYAIRKLTGWEIGLIALVVGWLVGGAVRLGSRHRGGWLYQALAVSLTYLAIVSTYVPDIVAEWDVRAAEEAAAEAAEEEMAAEVTENEAWEKAMAEAVAGLPAAEEDVDAAGASDDAAGDTPRWFRIVVACVLALAVPFLGGLRNVIGIIIIGFAVWEAWRMNARPKLVITGPHRLGPGESRPEPPPLPEAT